MPLTYADTPEAAATVIAFIKERGEVRPRNADTCHVLRHNGDVWVVIESLTDGVDPVVCVGRGKGGIMPTTPALAYAELLQI